jgi:hypothetical protein
MDQDKGSGEAPLLIFPNFAAMAWAQRATELASLMGLAAIVTAESLVNLSRRAIRPSSNSDETYRHWGSEPLLARRTKRRTAGQQALRFLAGPHFWAGLAAGGASAFAAVMLVRHLNER